MPVLLAMVGLVVAAHATGCAAKRIPPPDRGADQIQMETVVALDIKVPSGMEAFAVALPPVRVSAAVPGRPKVFGDTLERCLEESLRSGRPLVTVRDGDADWILDVDLMQFGRSTEGESTAEATATGYGTSKMENESSFTWRVAASATLRRGGDGAAVVADAWTSEIRGEDVDSSVTRVILMVIVSSNEKKAMSYSQCLAVLAQKVAQEAVGRIHRLQEDQPKSKEETP